MLSLDVETRIYVGDVIFSTELSMTSFLLRAYLHGTTLSHATKSCRVNRPLEI